METADGNSHLLFFIFIQKKTLTSEGGKILKPLADEIKLKTHGFALSKVFF
ncbi:hypothetical protein [Lysinibacillus sp. NPDC056232]|uniref:hypothetical protein n=1 Tax=Lysinibacillus sp. NPDC056232 TaxID=3345756 RepID=UPI0035DA1877